MMNWKALLLLSGTLSLVACGGGNSSDDDTSSVSYSGKTTAAVVDEQSAPVLVDAVFGGVDSQIAPPAALAADVDSAEFDAISGIRLLNDSVMPLVDAAGDSAADASRALVSESGSEAGPCSGSVTATYIYDDNDTPDYVDDDLPVEIRINYNNYSDCEVLLDGSMTLTLHYVGTEMSGMELSTSNYTMIYNGQRISYNGSYLYTLGTYTTSGYDTFLVTMDYSGYNGTVYRMEDYKLEMDAGQLITISGRIYDPAYGYVDISTPTPFTYGSCGYLPDAGDVLIQGEGQGKVEIDATGSDCYTYTMTWTTDGGATGSEIRNW